jgi:hypothetical protein
MLYERSIRTCYENSVAKLIKTITHSIECSTDSLQKDLHTATLVEEDILHLAKDAILAKRVEN